MTTTVTCPTTRCRQTWAVVTSTRKAHPGVRTQPKRVTVPLEDIVGNRLGTHRVDTSHWVSQGTSVALDVRQDDTETVWSWPCLCFRQLEHREPRMELVKCSHRQGRDGLCAVAAIHAKAPADLYVNARYGGACACCGHQGSHLVRVDRQGPLPQCLRSTVVPGVDPYGLAANA